MPKKSTIVTGVPKELLDELHARLVDSNFSNYEEHTQWLNDQLNEQNIRLKISKSALHRHGQGFEEDFAAYEADRKRIYEMCKASIENNADPTGVVREVATQSLTAATLKVATLVGRLELSDSTDALEQSQIIEKLANALKRTNDTGIDIQNFKDNYKAKLKAEMAEKIATTVKANGVSPETIEIIRKEVLGMS